MADGTINKLTVTFKGKPGQIYSNNGLIIPAGVKVEISPRTLPDALLNKPLGKLKVELEEVPKMEVKVDGDN